MGPGASFRLASLHGSDMEPLGGEVRYQEAGASEDSGEGTLP